MKTKELKELLERATKGPWRACRSFEDFDGPYFDIEPEEKDERYAQPFTHITHAGGSITSAHDCFEFKNPANAALISLTPTIAAELIRCRELLAGMLDEFARYHPKYNVKKDFSMMVREAEAKKYLSETEG